MPAIASLEDLKAAQRDLLEVKDLGQLKVVSKEVTQSSLLIRDGTVLGGKILEGCGLDELLTRCVMYNFRFRQSGALLGA